MALEKEDAMQSDLLSATSNDDSNVFNHEWQQIEGAVISQKTSEQEEHALIEETKADDQNSDNLNAAQILITLDNTERKCIYKISKNIQIDPINDDDYKEMINFIHQTFGVNNKICKLYESEEKEIFVEDAEDLQTSLEAFDDDNKLHLCLQNKAKCCVVVIGTTGSGKSSLIRLLSENKKVKTSGGVESDTHIISLIQDEHDQDLYYLDTIGTGDSKRKFNDAQILKLAFKHLYNNDIDNIKIIWSVKGDTERKEAQFSQQAEFIKNLQQNNDECGVDGGNNSSPWHSCLIIKKDGGSDDDNIEGVIAAAKEHGAQNINTKEHLFGFKCIDWKKYKQTQYIAPDKLIECGYYKSDEAKKIISNKINGMPSFKLIYRNEKCIKCGTIGDPRYIDAKCHTTKELLHETNKPSFKHIGKLVPYHDMSLGVSYVEKNHCGQQKSIHSGTIRRYHNGELQLAKARTAAAVVGDIMTGGMASLYMKRFHSVTLEQFWWWSCCERYKNDTTTCCAEWTCCDEDQSVVECTAQNAVKIWTCCGQDSTSDGCVDVDKTLNVWKCCQQDVSSSGCKFKWDCCNKIGIGCKTYFPCCDGDVDSDGCCYKCSNCKKKWGDCPGCVSVE